MNDKETPIHVHVLKRHVSASMALLLILAVIVLAVGGALFYTSNFESVNNFYITGPDGNNIALAYGGWPALENAEFFEKVKKELISQKTSFIEANLTQMKLRLYQDGTVIKEVPIASKGREGSWWETPAGLYQVSSKEESHFSSFGRVYMPWSMQFQGNFFIHGWPHYDDGTPVPQGFSGGCIRLSSDDAKEIYTLSDKNIPVLIYKESFSGSSDGTEYDVKNILDNDASYLVADLQNNFVFTQNDPTVPRSVASLTKLLSALVAVEYINVEKEVIIDETTLVETSIPRLYEGEEAIVLDLLSLLLMESSNEAALAIAKPLGKNRFVQLMNTKADAIGMNNSEFVDTSGVLAGNVSTAEDLFLLSKYLYHNRSFVLHMSVGDEERSIYGPSKYKNVSNLNLVPGVAGVVGGKTGNSSSADDNMLSIVEMSLGGENRPIAFIVLGSDDSKRDVKMLYDYIKENFTFESDAVAVDK